MEKKYGLPVAIAMVVGTVIGSGVFFKAETVLNKTGGNMLTGIAAWLIVGLVMIICSYAFGVISGHYEGVDGLVGFAKASCGKSYSYYVGWFMALIYYPSLTSVLCWLPARYFGVLVGWDDPTSGPVLALAAGFMAVTYAMNALSPKLAGKFQVSTTVIKLIPLALMAVVGTIVGLTNGQITYNFANIVDPSVAPSAGLFAAVVALSFAYEGWICATSIGSELKDSKRNLPKALIIGAVIVVLVYVLYYIGLSGALDSATMMEGGQAGAKMAFQNIFGQVGGVAIFVFVVISCWGTCNGLMMAVTRGMYDLACDGENEKLAIFRTVDPHTNMPTNSSAFGLLVTGLWLVYFYGANLTEGWFGVFDFDSSELPIITLYAMYIPIFIALMKEKNLGGFKRIVAPILAILCSLFMVFATFYAYKMTVVYYLILFAVIMVIGVFFKGKKKA
jgi:APA family basic amino acid/polyamine antiporter